MLKRIDAVIRSGKVIGDNVNVGTNAVVIHYINRKHLFVYYVLIIDFSNLIKAFIISNIDHPLAI